MRPVEGVRPGGRVPRTPVRKVHAAPVDAECGEVVTVACGRSLRVTGTYSAGAWSAFVGTEFACADCERKA